MKIVRLAASAAFLAGVLTAAPALAADQDFTVNNKTGFAITELMVSPTSSDNWGPDILGVDTLASGNSAKVTFDRDESQCNWDIKVNYKDGTTNEMKNVNLCETGDVTFNPSDD